MFLISDGIPEYALFVILMVLMRVFEFWLLRMSSCSCASRETCVSPDCSLVLTRQMR